MSLPPIRPHLSLSRLLAPTKFMICRDLESSLSSKSTELLARALQSLILGSGMPEVAAWQPLVLYRPRPTEQRACLQPNHSLCTVTGRGGRESESTVHLASAIAHPPPFAGHMFFHVSTTKPSPCESQLLLLEVGSRGDFPSFPVTSPPCTQTESCIQTHFIELPRV